MSPTGCLSASELAFFIEHGYLVIPNWLSDLSMAAMRDAVDRIISAVDLSSVPRSVFTTDEQARTADAYFLGSGDTVRVFFEAGAFDAEGALVQPLHESINKIGHALHELEPEFRAVSFDPRVAALCRSLGYVQPRIVQSMHIIKPPVLGGEVRPHVDGAFLYTRPQSVLGVWWPLEACTTSNGCLWVCPGSHVRPVTRRFKRSSGGATLTEFEPPEAQPFDTAGAVPLEMAAGGAVLLHSALVHYSEANKSSRSRHAYSVHVVEGGKGVLYPEDNWLQRSDGASFPALYGE